MDGLEEGSRHLCMVQSPSGTSIAICEWIPTVLLCTGGPRWVCNIWRMVNFTPSYEMHQLFDDTCIHSWTLPSCAIFLDDEQLVVGFADGTIRWWDVASVPLATPEPRGVLTIYSEYPGLTSLSLSPRHSFLLACTQEGRSPTVAVLRRMKGDMGAEGSDFVPHVFLHGHQGQVEAACISPCERYIATASEDTTVRLWSVGDGLCIWTFVNHAEPATQVVFSPDGRILASADKDGAVCLYPLSRFVRGVPPVLLVERT